MNYPVIFGCGWNFSTQFDTLRSYSTYIHDPILKNDVWDKKMPILWPDPLHMASSVEVMEDLLEFTPFSLIWAFHACGEEGDGCLDILSSLFA